MWGLGNPASEVYMVYNKSKRFFSEKKAGEFAEKVDGTIWSSLDCFGQIVYDVKW